VEALGIGSSVRKLTVESLTEALVYATTDEKQIDRAKLVGEQIRAENGVTTAIEAIYRDLEYARSLIKAARAEDSSGDEEGGTIRDQQHRSRSLQSTPDRAGASSADSNQGAPSEDWSVISDPDDKRSSQSRRSGSLDRSPSGKRSTIAAAVLSVLPDSLTHSSKGHSRNQST